MVAFVKFHQFNQDVGRGVHNLHTGVLKVALTNTAPTASTGATISDITQISGGGYAVQTVLNSSYAQTGGVGKLAGDDVTFTASGGTMGPFRYAVLYNDTPTSPADPLIGYWDRGASLTLQDGESFTQDFSDNTSLISIT